MHKQGLLGKSKLIALVKEIAPCATAKDDTELGVSEFQSKYFNNYPVYLDQDKTFYTGDLPPYLYPTSHSDSHVPNLDL